MGLLRSAYRGAMGAVGNTAAGWGSWFETPEGQVYAPMRRVKWDVRLALRLGRWERAEVEAIRQVIDPSAPLVELGGGLGAVSLALNRDLERPQDHVVVEANPVTFALLEQTRRKNGAPFKARNAAVSYGAAGQAVARRQFGAGDKFSSSPPGVPTLTLRQLVEEAGFDRFNLVMDIEGAEYDVFANEMALLRKSCRSLCFEFHDHPDAARAGHLLREAGSLPWTKFSASMASLGYGR